MGCDIHTSVEECVDGTWILVDRGDEIFGNRNYGVFGFLADVRNYSMSPFIAEPRGLPDDVSFRLRAEHDDWGFDAHSASWLTAAELLAYDYDQTFWDRRITRIHNTAHGNYGDGAATADEGEGTHPTLREFLGDGFFRDLNQLVGGCDPKTVRIVFWFDN